MARPLSKDEDLKNPRRFRKSSTVPEIRSLVYPSSKVIKAYRSLVHLCVTLVANNIERDKNFNIVNKKAVSIRFKTKGDKPAWMPSGKWTIVENGYIMSLNAELMLTALYEQRLTEYYPNLVYRMRGRMGVSSVLGDINIEEI